MDDLVLNDDVFDDIDKIDQAQLDEYADIDDDNIIIVEEPKEVLKDKSGKPAKVMNVSNKELLEELGISRKQGRATEKLGELFMKLAKHYLNRYEWRNYTYKDEFYSLCLLYMCSCWDKFDPEKSSQAFSYFTQVCYSACLRHLAYEKKASKIKDEMYKDFNQKNQTGFINHYDGKPISNDGNRQLSSDDVKYQIQGDE